MAVKMINDLTNVASSLGFSGKSVQIYSTILTVAIQ